MIECRLRICVALACSMVVLTSGVALGQDCLDYRDYIRWNTSFGSGYAGQVQIVDDLAYVAAYGSGLIIIDISDPDDVTILGSYDTSDQATGLSVSGGLAFLACWEDGLVIVDVTDPTNPALVTTLDTPYRARDVVAAGDHAFVADVSTVISVNVADPANPYVVDSIATNSNYEIAHAGGYVYLAAGSLDVIDASDPTNLQIVQTVAGIGSGRGLDIDGSDLFVTDGGSLKIIDISTPVSAFVYSTLSVGGVGEGVSVLDDVAFYASANGGGTGLGFVTIDVSNRNNPAVIGSVPTPGDARNVASNGTVAVVCDGYSGIHVFDLPGFQSAGPIGVLDTPSSADHLVVDGDHAYVADWGSGLQIIDVSDAASPNLVGNVDTPGYACRVAKRNEIVYVADRQGGIQVVDVSNPNAPVIVSNLATPGTAYAIAVEGDIAAVADHSAGIHVVDLANPTQPVILSSLDTYGIATGIAVRGDMIYVADGGEGLVTIDISDPLDPIILGWVDTPDSAVDVDLYGFYAFVADASGSIATIDIADPRSPHVIETESIWSGGKGVKYASGIAYLAGYRGLRIFDVGVPDATATMGDVFGFNAEGVDLSESHVVVAAGQTGVVTLLPQCATGSAYPELRLVSDSQTIGCTAPGRIDVGLSLGESTTWRAFSVQIDATGPVAFSAQDVTLEVAEPGVMNIIEHGPSSLTVDFAIFGDSDPVDDPGGLFSLAIHGQETGYANLSISNFLVRDAENMPVDGIAAPDPISLLVNCYTGDQWYVSPTGSDSASGAPDDPLATIQAALLLASDGQEILLYDGVYAGEGNRDIDFLAKQVTVRSATGDSSLCVVDGGGANGFWFRSGEGANSIVESITIRNCDNALLIGDPNGEAHASPTVRRCAMESSNTGIRILDPGNTPTIELCSAHHNGEGLVVAEGAPGVTITHCMFSYNTGAGVSSVGWESLYGSPLRLQNCEIRENDGNGVTHGASFGHLEVVDSEVVGNGGWGVYSNAVEDGILSVGGCQVLQNGSGGVGSTYTYSVGVSNCEIAENQGVGVTTPWSTYEFHVSGCTIRDNTSHGVFVGWGAARRDPDQQRDRYDTHTVSGCEIYRNSGLGVNFASGDVGFGAAVSSSTIWQNEQGGIAMLASNGYEATFTLSGMTIADNIGAGLELESDIPTTIANTLIAGNDGAAVVSLSTSALGISCTDIYGNAGGDWTGPIAPFFGQDGNIAADPLFCGDDNPDDPYTLAANSPCAADNNPGCGQVGALGVGCPAQWTGPDWHVAIDGDDVNGDGSPQLPFATIQHAVDTAGAGDTIILTTGTFTGPGNRDLDFLGKPLHLRSQSGDPADVTIDCEASVAEPHVGFWFTALHDSTTVIEGVTVDGAYTTSEAPGGFTYRPATTTVDVTSGPRILSCVFRGAHGQGIHVGRAEGLDPVPAMLIDDCLVHDSTGSGIHFGVRTRGGRVRGTEIRNNGDGLNTDAASSPFDPEAATWIVDCHIHDNLGPGVWGNPGEPSRVRIVGCDINDNAGDGVACEFGLLVHDCEILRNDLRGIKAADPESGMPPTDDMMLTVSGSIIGQNEQGGIEMPVGHLTISDTDILENSGNGIRIIESDAHAGQLTLSNVLITHGQMGVSVGSVYTDMGFAISATGCTVVATASNAFSLGDWWPGTTSLSLHNTLVTACGGDLFLGDHAGVSAVTCTDIFGNANGDWTGLLAGYLGTDGNISADPQFCGDQNPGDPFTLADTSPCAPGNHPDGANCDLIGARPVGCSTPLLFVAEPPSLAVPENGAASVELTLNRPPSAPVAASVALQTDDPGLELVGPATLAFDDQNWDQPQAVTLHALDDADYCDGAGTLTISDDAAVVDPLDVPVTSVDDDELPPDTIAFATPSGCITSELEVGAGSVLDLAIVLANPSASTINGFEAQLVIEPSGAATVLSVTFPSGGTNFGDDMLYLVGYQTPVIVQPVTLLAQLNLLVQIGDPVTIRLETPPGGQFGYTGDGQFIPYSGTIPLVINPDTAPQYWMDVTDGTPLGDAGNSMGCAWGDFDGDGDDDLYVVNVGAANHLYCNDGTGGFTDVTAPPLDDAGNSNSGTWADYDGDGDLDLYLVNDGPNRLFRNEGASCDDVVFTDQATGLLADEAVGSASWADYDRDGDLDLCLANVNGPSRLLRNDGGGSFVDDTPPALAGAGVVRAAVWGDYDDDGDLDLYVSVNGSNLLFTNTEGILDASGTPSVIADPGNGVGAAWGDYDGDQLLDLYVVNTGEANQLYRNEGAGSFSNQTTGPLGDTDFGRSAAWLDVDNDGDLDLHLTNNGSSDRLLRNDGGVFVDATDAVVGDEGTGHGASLADVDGDGDLDLHLCRYAQENRLFAGAHESGNHWLQIDLAQTAGVRHAIGARVVLTAGGDTQIREVTAGSGYLSQHSRTLEFGLGQAGVVESLTVRWPDGEETTHTVDAVDTRMEIVREITGFTIAGAIVDAEDLPLAGVRLEGFPGEVHTDSSGAYAAFVSPSWEGGEVTPVKLAYEFSPPSIQYDPPTADLDGQDYTGTRVGWGVWGHVLTAGDEPVPGVTVAGFPDSVVTDSTGYYETVVPPGYVGDQVPLKHGFRFDPSSRWLYQVAADTPAQDYLAETDPFDFVDVAAGDLVDGAPNRGLAWTDLDGDGHDDVYLVRDGAANVLLRGEDGFGFQADTPVPLADVGHGVGATWGDHDRDGDRDLYLVNSAAAGELSLNRLFTNQGDGTFVETTQGDVQLPGQADQAAWVDVDGDARLDLYIAREPAGAGHRNLLLRGVLDLAADTPSGLDQQGSHNGFAWADLDGDGLLDCFLTRQDYYCRLLVQQTDGTFVTSGQNFGGLVDARSVSVADFDNDGDLDLFVTRWATHNQLLVNDGAGQFATSTYQELWDYRQSQVGVWGDYDNDGWQDLYVVNHDTPDELYHNEQGGSFTRVSAGLMAAPGLGHCASWCDVDADGRLDLLVPRSEASNWLFHNETGTDNHWLRVRLVGFVNNPDGYGALVRLHAGGLVQTRHVESTVGLAGQAPDWLHFGLGTAAAVDSVVVDWPNGARQSVVPDAVDVTITIDGADAPLQVDADDGLPRTFALGACYPNPFNPQTTIAFDLPRACEVRLDIFDIRGRRVRRLVGEHYPAGRHRVIWQGRDDGGRAVASGTYFYRIAAEDFRDVRRMLLVK